jgi:hypothetical protein
VIKRKIGRRPQDTPVGHLPAENGSDGIGPLRMWTGMYTYPAIENVPVLDMLSNPCAKAVEVSLPSEPGVRTVRVAYGNRRAVPFGRPGELC